MSKIETMGLATFEELQCESAWPPTENGMPVLDEEAYPDTLLAAYIAAPESLAGGLHTIALNFARLSDKAVREYRLARECLSGFLLTPGGVASLQGHTLLLRATDHLENCVDTIRRVEGYYKTEAFMSVASPEQREMLTEIHADVHGLRNKVQHADEKVIPEGEPLIPALTSHGVYFAGRFVFYGNIAAQVIGVWLLAAAGVDAVRDPCEVDVAADGGRVDAPGV